jgi:hypothetical protein
MRLLLGDADRGQGVQDGPALDFKFPCKIVDANFAHCFLLLRAGDMPQPFFTALAGHNSLDRSESLLKGIIP